MTDLTIRDVFDLPPTIPRCIVKIQDFDDEQTLQENIRDYVITDTVAAAIEREDRVAFAVRFVMFFVVLLAFSIWRMLSLLLART